MLSLLTLESSMCREGRGCGTGSPETVCFELSLVGHVTSLASFFLSKATG